MTNFLQFEVITFDCYGTLIDWEQGILAAFRYAVRDRLAGVKDEAILAAYGEAEAEIEAGAYLRYRDVFQRTSERVIDKLGDKLDESNRGFLANSIAQWEPFEDSAGALKKLRSRFRLGVISNIDRDLLAASNTKLGNPFTYLVTAEDVGAYKPAHLNFAFAERVMGVKRERWLHVAQSLFHDIRPCNELGISSVWINRYGIGSGAVKSANAAPDASFKNLREFADAACDEQKQSPGCPGLSC